MTLELIFWVLMLLWIILGGATHWPVEGRPVNRFLVGGHLLLFFIILVLGWKVFGAPLKG